MRGQAHKQSDVEAAACKKVCRDEAKTQDEDANKAALDAALHDAWLAMCPHCARTFSRRHAFEKHVQECESKQDL